MQALGFVRRIIGALAAGGMLAGCGGGTPWQSPAAVSPNVGTLMHAQAAEKYSTKKALLFQADEAEAAVNIYATGGLRHNPPPIATLHVAEGCPTGLAMDSSGTLYVADGVYINGDVEEYPKGSMKLKTTITDGVSGPQALAIDAKNNLYVLNHPPTIAVYAPGSTAPFITFSGGGMILPSALALDKQSNLYIADPFAGAVFEVKAGYFSVQKLDLKGLAQPFGLAFEARTGYLWVTDGNENVINVYDLSRSKSPIKTLPGNGDPNTITASDVGETKVEMAVADLERDEVYVYKRKEHTPYAGISNGIQLTTALLIRKP